MPVPITKKRHRVTFDFTPEAYAKFQEIRRRSHSVSNSETVRDALRVLSWFLDLRDGEKSIQLVSKNGRIERVNLLI